MTPDDASPPLDTALEALADAADLVVITGAGVSLASGIPTFRGTDPDAVWSRDVTELGTAGYFRRDPAGSWRWYLDRFEHVLTREPNPAHRALAELEGWWQGARGDFLLVTQNVDLLHEAAGSRRLVKIHGTADRVRCSRDGCELAAPRGSLARATVDIEPFRRSGDAVDLPRCPQCDAILRQHVLWFDEYYQGHQDYRLEEALAAAERADLLLFVGTSFSVGITDLLLHTAYGTGARVLAVDPGAGGAGRHLPGVDFLRQPAEELLPALVAAMDAT